MALIISVLGALIHGVPAPLVHDEFSNLFAAETFVRFRLANPSPPTPDAFFSPHILVEPTFSSKYPPAQSLFLAIGYLLGLPIIGVWVSGALAAAGLYWCARARLASHAALVPTVFFVISVLFVGRWITSYWGGLVPFLGGSLVIGFFLRLTNRSTELSAWLLLGVGVGLLVLSRPFEGLILGFALVLLFVDRLIATMRAMPGRLLLVRVAACSIVVGMALAFQAALNVAVTGGPLRLPYKEFHDQHLTMPSFRWQQRSEPLRPDVRLLEVEESFAVSDSWLSHLADTLGFAGASVIQLGGPVLIIALLFASLLAVRRDQRLVAIVLIVPLLQTSANYVHFSHYYAPVAPLWFLLPGFAIAHAPARWPVRGRTLVAAALVASVVSMLPRWLDQENIVRTGTRDAILAEFATHAPILVFVRYEETVTPHLAVVYNDPELQNPVLLANYLDHERNCEVMQHFDGREVRVITILSSDAFETEAEVYAPCGFRRTDPLQALTSMAFEGS